MIHQVSFLECNMLESLQTIQNWEILYFHLQRLNNRGMGMEIGEIKFKKLFEVCWLI